jgi:predicted glutamine amidotransferase
MCRLGGISSEVNVDLEEFFGGMRRLSEAGHSHGAGAVIKGTEDARYRAPFHTTEPAHQSDDFEDVLNEKANLGLIHLRYATVGKPGNINNIHPFVDGRHAMAHNGTAILFSDRKGNFLESIRRLEGGRILQKLNVDKASGKLRGSTDSEHLFRIYLAYLGNESELHEMGFASMARALAQTVLAVTRSDDPEYERLLRQNSALNMVVTDAITNTLVATCYGRDLYVSDGRPRETVDSGPPPKDGDYVKTLVVASQPSPTEFSKYNWWRVRDGFVVGRDRDGLFQAKRIEEMASPYYAYRLGERDLGFEQDGLKQVDALEPNDTVEHGLSNLKRIKEELKRYWSVRDMEEPEA